MDVLCFCVCVHVLCMHVYNLQVRRRLFDHMYTDSAHSSVTQAAARQQVCPLCQHHRYCVHVSNCNYVSRVRVE